jgi:tetrahydromethanopterin S-methyltransferase subunit G
MSVLIEITDLKSSEEPGTSSGQNSSDPIAQIVEKLDNIDKKLDNIDKKLDDIKGSQGRRFSVQIIGGKKVGYIIYIERPNLVPN